VSASSLDGRTYRATSAHPRRLAAGAELTLLFEDGAVIARGGCNTQRAGYELRDGRLVLTGPMMTTLMACEPELMEQDRWIAELLADGPAMEAVDEQLTLRGAGSEVVLRVLARD
jgi:heat shock protein HslJ